MQSKDFKLPKTVNDLRIRHLKPLTNSIYEDEMTIELLCDFMAEFTGKSVNVIRQIDTKDLIRMFQHVKEIYSDIRINPPRKTITMGGQEWVLVDPHKVGCGWHMDFSMGNIKENPEWLACLFYYPKGVKYGATDENDNLLYPIAERIDMFKDEMSLQDFLNASGFFLRKISKSMILSTAQKLQANKASKLRRGSSGKQ